jgi:alpha-beta hydrolase superfamily lysophospholipase
MYYVIQVRTGKEDKTIDAIKRQIGNKEGFDVYALDTYGQGLNVKEDLSNIGIWPEEGFAKQVEAVDTLVLKLQEGTKKPVFLFSHSMGSFMTQSRLERYPLAADKTIIIGSNGGQGGLMSIAAVLAKMLIHKSNWDKPNKFFTNLGLGGYNKQIKNPRTNVDWLSYNEANVDAYVADPYLGHMNTGGFWREFLIGMSTIWKGKNMKKVNADEVILIASGEEDPVGQNGKGVNWLEQQYKKLGVKNVELKLYPHMRHEIHNETDHQQVYDDFVNFILK